MKISENFILKDVADTHVVVPVGANSVSFKAIISLNDTGAFLWHQLENDKTVDELVAAMLDSYNIDEATARADIEAFVNNMKDSDLLA